MTAEPRFLPMLALLLSGFIAWVAHFLLIYGYTGLLCSRPEWARIEIAGHGVILLGIAAITVLALAALVIVLAWHGLLRARRRDNGGWFETPFYRHLAQGGTALGAIGIIWEGLLSISLVPSCW